MMPKPIISFGLEVPDHHGATRLQFTGRRAEKSVVVIVQPSADDPSVTLKVNNKVAVMDGARHLLGRVLASTRACWSEESGLVYIPNFDDQQRTRLSKDADTIAQFENNGVWTEGEAYSKGWSLLVKEFAKKNSYYVDYRLPRRNKYVTTADEQQSADECVRSVLMSVLVHFGKMSQVAAAKIVDKVMLESEQDDDDEESLKNAISAFDEKRKQKADLRNPLAHWVHFAHELLPAWAAESWTDLEIYNAIMRTKKPMDNKKD